MLTRRSFLGWLPAAAIAAGQVAARPADVWDWLARLAPRRRGPYGVSPIQRFIAGTAIRPGQAVYFGPGDAVYPTTVYSEFQRELFVRMAQRLNIPADIIEVHLSSMPPIDPVA